MDFIFSVKVSPQQITATSLHNINNVTFARIFVSNEAF